MNWLTHALIATIAIAAISRPANAAEQKKPDPKWAALDGQTAGPDFAVQGEYAAFGAPVGVQVIALGDGQFRAIILADGLPGSGRNGQDKLSLEGKSDDGKAVFPPIGGVSGSIADGVMTLNRPGEDPVQLHRIVRQSPTLGAKPPEGAIVLFDGTNVDAWKNGRIDEQKRLRVGPISKQSFGDCTLHVEFMLPFMPYARGQGRANSGVYLHHRYEVQVLDSFGLEGKDNECGGIYRNASPKVNMCAPPLSWQTYDIDFTAPRFDAAGAKIANARITVRHNGVVIHENQEIKAPTGGGQGEEAPIGPLFLQEHGNPVVYRNVWIVEKK